jgi:hypothetical protein
MAMPNAPPRKLRAATEAADALGAQAFETPAPGLPLASPPPTPVMTAIPRSAAPATPRGMTAAPAQTMPSQPSKLQPPLAPTRQPETLIGATIVKARKRRGVLLHWIAASAVAAMLGVVAYLVTQDSTDAVAGSASPPAAPPAAARAPTPPPAPPKPVHTEPPPPPPPAPTPAQVRVRIVTHPPDAAITLDGKKLGKTPYDAVIDADPATHVFRVRLRGYGYKRLDLPLDADIDKDIALTPSR